MLEAKYIDKFYSSFQQPMVGCWEWNKGKDKDGYGMLYVKNKTYKAHRISYLLLTGSPEGKFVCHSCDNPSCVRPSHLFLGTAYDNNQDRHRKGKSKNKPFYGEAHPMAKLTAQDVLAIKNDSTSLLKELALLYKVSPAQISRIKNNKSHVNVNLELI